MGNIANVLYTQGKTLEASEMQQQVLAMVERSLDPEHPTVGATHFNLGSTLRKLGRLDEATAHFLRAVEIWEAGLGPSYPRLSYPLVGLARVSLAQRRYREAQQFAQRAMDIREQAPLPATVLAEAQFVLARALWATAARRPDALTLAAQARDTYAQAGDSERSALDETNAWLAKHRVRP